MNESTLALDQGFGLNLAPLFLSAPSSSPFGFAIASIISAIALSLLYGNVLYPKLSSVGRSWSSYTWAIDPGMWFGRLRGQFKSVKHTRSMVDFAYEKYSKQGQAFFLPTMGHNPVLILPPGNVRELLGKSDTELDIHDAHETAIQSDYTIRNKRLSEDLIHVEVVRRELTRKLPTLTADVHAELVHGMRRFWSNTSESWNTVPIYPTAMRIVSGAANRVFAGTQLCRNEDFLLHSQLYTQGVFGGAGIINLFPAWMRPVMGPIITYPNRKNFNICQRIAVPVIEKRLELARKKQADPDFEYEVPNDALQWLIDLVLERGDPFELQPKQICHRLLFLNMVAIHTTSMTIANTIMDIYSSPNSKEIIEGLREECERVLAQSKSESEADGKIGNDENDGIVWTKQAVNDLLRVDSALRESMRYSDLSVVALKRLVVAKDGAHFQNGTIHVPQGVHVALSRYGIHRDSDYYPDADTYDAFRFSAPREAYEAQKKSMAEADGQTGHQQDRNNNADDLQKRTLAFKQQAVVSVSDSFLSFGNGRHACPGRFFAAQEMKLMLADIVLRYDIEIVGGGGNGGGGGDKRGNNTRPPNIELVGNLIPSDTAQMRVRRRAASTLFEF